MSYITKYGSFWGMIPQTSGRIFWVAPSASYTVEGVTYTASDGNDGLSPERAVLTLDFAVGLTTANVGDVIVLLPGDHSWAASVALDVAGITITGLPGGRGNPQFMRTSITTSAADQIINVTAANCEIAYLRIIPVTAQTAIDYTAAADQLFIHHCSFDMNTPAVNVATRGIFPTTPIIIVDRLTVYDCFFESDGAQGEAISPGDGTGYDFRNNTFICTAGTWALVALCTGLTTQTGSWIGNHFICQGGTAITKAISGGNLTKANAVYAAYNNASLACTMLFDDWTASDISMIENYHASGGGSAAVYTVSGGFLEDRLT